uniref:Thioredoxin domain-containing protein n=1 Tax=Picea sitchensis TaxID=3332 RepID=A9NNM6_PICSI|nr:unknown [Picea sitchensis]
MACVLETVGISSPLTASRPSRRTSNTVVCASVLRGKRSFNRKNLYLLPSCRGLRIEGHDNKGLSVSYNEKRTRGFRNVVCEAQETVAQVQDVNDGTWKTLVLDSDIPVLVDFWAPWCGPCRMIEPLIDELAKQYSGKIRCLKLNTDESPRIATEYGIRSIPTVMLFKNGEKKDTVIGAVPKTTLTASIEKYVEW